MKVLLLSLMGMGVVAAWGHDCGEPVSMCQRSAYANGIFVARVVQLYDVSRKAEVKLLVEVLERFKGIGPEEKYVLVGEFAGFRSISYEVGGEYLIFANNLHGRRRFDTEWLGDYPNRERLSQWNTGICAANEPRDEQSLKLRWLRTSGQAKGGAQLSGWVWQRTPGVGRRQRGQAEGKVRLRGEGREYETGIGEGFMYQFPDVAPGTYALWAEAPTGEISEAQTVEVKGAFCEMRTIYMNAAGGVRGQLWLEEGNAAIGLKVQLVEVMPNGELDELPLDEAVTDKAGRYRFDSIPAGRYLVGLGILDAATAEQPWETLLQNERPVRSTAQWVTVREGQIVEGVNWTLPAALAVRDLQIRVMLPEGKAELDLELRVAPARIQRYVPSQKLAAGTKEVQLRIVAGVAYRILVMGSSREGEEVRWYTGETMLAAGAGAATVLVRIKED